MSETYSRKCYPCSVQGIDRPAGANGKGVPNSRRARIGGVIRPVCDPCGDTLKGARAAVAGTGHAARQAAETSTMVDGDTLQREQAAEHAARVESCYPAAAATLTPEIMRTFARAAARHGYGTLADAAEREMVETYLRRTAERLALHCPRLSDAANLRKAQSVTMVNVSERRHALNVRADIATDSGDGPTFGENLPAPSILPETFAARLADGRIIGAADLARLVRQYPGLARECGVTA